MRCKGPCQIWKWLHPVESATSTSFPLEVSLAELHCDTRTVSSGWMPVCLTKPRASLSKEDTALAARVLALPCLLCAINCL